MPNKLIKYFILITGAWMLLTACGKETDRIPNVPVDIYINTTSPLYTNLNAVGGYIYITGGVKGIIVYRSSVTDFVALDRCCSNKPSESCERVEADTSTALFLIDKCCGSKFLMTDGSVQNGPAILPLKRYGSSFDGQTVHIYN